MHLTLPVDIGELYAMQFALIHAQTANRAAANLSSRFHQDIKVWCNLCANITDLPT